VPFDQVMDFSVIQKLAGEPFYANQKNEYQVQFVPTSASAVQAESNEILTKSIVIQFYPNSDDIEKTIEKTVDGKTVQERYDPNAPFVVEEAGKLAGQFGAARKNMDCKHCGSCSITSNRCQNACDAGAPSDVSFPDTCKPLREDGLICLRALNAASCDDYARYMDDQSPEVPTECQFCREGAPPAPTVFATDAGTPSAPTDGGAP